METVNNNTTPTETNPLTQAYETSACGRCGGSGQYSYCQMYGTRCFGCHGRGQILTKRGQAAMDFGKALRTIKASDVKVGMLVFETAGPLGGKTGWFTATKSEAAGDRWVIETSQVLTHHFLDSDVQAVENKARLLEVKREALAYQATLTKKGTVAPAGYFAAEAKREATRAAKAAAAQVAYEAEQAAQAAAHAAMEAEAQAKADARTAELEAARAAERAKSEYVGTVGERREFSLTCEFTVRLEAFTYGAVAPVLYGCRDDKGNRVVYKGSASFLRKGETAVVTATIKEHREYKGEAQTVLTRPKVAREPEAAETMEAAQ